MEPIGPCECTYIQADKTKAKAKAVAAKAKAKKPADTAPGSGKMKRESGAAAPKGSKGSAEHPPLKSHYLSRSGFTTAAVTAQWSRWR